jgi:hypothetical protein
MHPALLLLLRLRRRAFWRRLLAGLQTVRGAALLVATAIFFCLMVLPQFIVPIVNALSPAGAKANRQLTEAAIPVIRTLGPLALLAYALLSVATSLGEAAIYFTPAEVDLLFPGPFSRRELLLYKLIQSIKSAVVVGTFFTVFAARYAPLVAGAWLGSVCTLLFINAFTLALTLLGQAVSQRAYNRSRRVVLAVATILVCLGLAPTLAQVDRDNLLSNVTRFRESLAGSILAAPFQVFPRIVTAPNIGELAIWSGLAVAMVAGLYCLAISLDANYLEAAQQISQRVYQRIQRRRQVGGGALESIPIRGAHRIRIPRLPWLWGIGPNVWRQCLLLVRRSQGLVFLMLIVAVMGGVIFLVSGQSGNKSPYLVPVAILSALAYQSLLASMKLPAGFRGDLDRIDWLKSLPLNPAAVVCGQISGAAILLSLLQAVLLLSAWAVCGGAYQIYASGLVMLMPVNLLCFAVDNLLFLIFPMRMGSATAGDFQFMGRFMLLAMLKMLLTVVGLVIASTGAIFYLVVPQLWLAVGCCLLLLTLVDALVVFLATQAFVRFDVSLDTPPE